MDHPETLAPVQDERIMAALSHVTALIPFMGVIAPIVIWATQKEKSQYVRNQSLQALVYQLINVVIVILGYACYFVGLFGSIMIMAIAGSSGRVEEEILPMLMMVIPFGVFMLLGLFEIFFMLYAVVAALMSLQGKPFQYILIGSRIQRYMEKKAEESTQTAA
jgi:uncharacterized Tic20 family protein